MKATLLIKVIFSLVILTIRVDYCGLRAEESVSKLSAQEAYEKAKLLNGQNKEDAAKELLKYAMENDHPQAMLMYSSLLMQNVFVQQKDESDYALKAAKLGNVNAMVKVTRSIHISKKEKDFFRNKALTILRKNIELGDVQAIGIMPGLYSDDDIQMEWVMRAAEAGHPHSQYYLAKRYQHGTYGWFLIPGNREKEVRRLYKASAKASYPPAMAKYAHILLQSGKRKESLLWHERRVDLGVSYSLLYLAKVYAGQHKKRQGIVPVDKIRAAAYYQSYFLNMAKVEQNKATYEHYHKLFQQLLSSMTEFEKQQADKLTQDYLSTHIVRAFDGFWEWGVDYGVRPEGK